MLAHHLGLAQHWPSIVSMASVCWKAVGISAWYVSEIKQMPLLLCTYLGCVRVQEQVNLKNLDQDRRLHIITLTQQTRDLTQWCVIVVSASWTVVQWYTIGLVVSGLVERAPWEAIDRPLMIGLLSPESVLHYNVQDIGLITINSKARIITCCQVPGASI